MVKDIQSKQIRIEIIRGDAFQLIKQVESNSIDLFFTDPFAGLGMFAIACKLTNRNYLGFEINEKYFHIVLDRIKKYNIQNDLFLEVDSDV